MTDAVDAQPPQQRPAFCASTAAVSSVIAVVILIAVVSVLAGTLFFVTSRIAGQDLQTDSFATVLPVSTDPTQFQFRLIGGQPQGYSVEQGIGTVPELVVVHVNGNECLYSAAEFQVEGSDGDWNAGERLTIVNDCSGHPLTRYLNYDVSISLGGLLAFQGSLTPGEGS